MRTIPELRWPQELLQGAVRTLAGVGSQQERLVNALTYCIGNLANPPDEIADRFHRLMARFDTGDGYDVAISRLDEVELNAVVEDILDMAGTVDRLWHTG